MWKNETGNESFDRVGTDRSLARRWLEFSDLGFVLFFLADDGKTVFDKVF